MINPAVQAQMLVRRPRDESSTRSSIHASPPDSGSPGVAAGWRRRKGHMGMGDVRRLRGRPGEGDRAACQNSHRMGRAIDDRRVAVHFSGSGSDPRSDHQHRIQGTEEEIVGMALDSMGGLLSRSRRAQGMVGTRNRPGPGGRSASGSPRFSLTVPLRLPAIFSKKTLTIRPPIHPVSLCCHHGRRRECDAPQSASGEERNDEAFAAFGFSREPSPYDDCGVAAGDPWHGLCGGAACPRDA